MIEVSLFIALLFSVIAIILGIFLWFDDDEGGYLLLSLFGLILLAVSIGACSDYSDLLDENASLKAQIQVVEPIKEPQKTYILTRDTIIKNGAMVVSEKLIETTVK